MSFLADIYHKSLAENEKNIRFWENYLQNLKSLDFSTFADKLRVPVMVPIGSRILFRGELKHTNEITVSLGADYFVKCSVKQAEVLRQHRIKDAESKLNMFMKEKEHIENQSRFSNEYIFQDQGQEIIEAYTEDGEKAWREKHKENVKRWKQKRVNEKSQNDIKNEELWNRLEELELKEELENELKREENESPKKDNEESFLIKVETVFDKRAIDYKNTENISSFDLKESKTAIDEPEKKVKFAEPAPKVEERDDILQKVRDKQYELEKALMELKNQDRGQSETQEDLIAKLDDLEKLEELQDEMERLDDIIDSEVVTSEEELGEENAVVTPEPQQVDLKRRVSFADLDDSETLGITFNHSDVEASTTPYDPEKGITKPSDVYVAFSNLFTETISILKKTKYEDKDTTIQLPKVEKKMQANRKVELLEVNESGEKTIVVKDVVEKMDGNENKLNDAEKRPMSLFKQRRQKKV